MKYGNSDKPLNDNHSAPDNTGFQSFYYRGSNDGSSGDVGGSSGDENDYGEKVVRRQPRRQRTPPPPLKTIIDRKANKVYQQTHLLGEGSYGYVHVAVDENGEKVALKTFKIFDIKESDVERERQAYQMIREHQPYHPNVVAPISYFKDGMIPCVTMELCSDKTLDTLLESRNALQEHEVRYFGQQLVAGVGHLHSLGLVHGDLKPLNLLLTENLMLKVGDFGQTRELTEGKGFRDAVGSLGFQAPEIFREEGLTYAVDVFAIGAVFFKMLLGIDYKLPGKMTDGNKPVKINGSLSLNARDLLERTLESDPKSRIKMPDLAVHPFLTDGPIPQQLSWDILRRAAPLATEDIGCQDPGVAAQTPEDAAQTPKDIDQTPEVAAQTQEEPGQAPDPAEPYFDPEDIGLLDDIFAEVEAKQAQAKMTDGGKNQKGTKKVAVCGDKTVREEDYNDENEEEERAKGHKKAKAMQKGVVREKEAPEDKEGGQGGDQFDWLTHLLSP
ncbi:MAG: kinase-like domain-containing protein [Linnemannia elongata]|nr:MAG: kinase-like domain-containing protein [Linnemannia elongata]